ncbi:MAG TPA: heavy-metal-associated domain-containing protein [Acidobacteriaceae bacterium]|jgi:Cu+-exporting ATPase|nr:heavy-metal-associated domain-containing protein [Acidobacteriaceae bacterium]
MIRRRFLGMMTLAGVGGVVAMEGMDLAEKKTVTFRISGFTCITCAVGLETLLEKERGVIRVKASYPENTATVTYHPKLASEQSVVKFIESAGFKATREG